MSQPVTWNQSYTVTVSSRDVLEMLKVLVQRCVNNVLVNIAPDLCIICYRQRESIVTCKIVVIPMNSRSIVLTCIKSLIIQSLYLYI